MLPPGVRIPDVTATPLGYVSAGATGAVRVTWDAVAGATSYQVGWATVSSGSGPYTFEDVVSGTSHDLVGLAGSDTTHHVVVRASDGASSLDSAEVTASSVVATGGSITSFVGDGTNGTTGTTYVVHTFATVRSDALTLNAAYALDHLIVGGGGCTGRGMCVGVGVGQVSRQLGATGSFLRGGDGTASSITGVRVEYGGGGGGGAGRLASAEVAIGAAVGGAGGSGVVIVRYALPA